LEVGNNVTYFVGIVEKGFNVGKMKGKRGELEVGNNVTYFVGIVEKDLNVGKFVGDMVCFEQVQKRSTSETVNLSSHKEGETINVG
jgi:hypothetical protein